MFKKNKDLRRMGPGINAVVTRVGNLGARSPGLIINNSELYL